MSRPWGRDELRACVPAYPAGNVAKMISVVFASTMSFFFMRYVIFTRRHWFKGRL